MKKKNPAVEWLNEIEKIDHKIRNKMIDAENLRELAQSVSVATDKERVQSSGKISDRMAEQIVKAADIQAEINKLMKQRMEMIEKIEMLQTDEYDLVHKRYLQKLTLQECASEMGVSYRAIVTMHGLALKHLWEIINGN